LHNEEQGQIEESKLGLHQFESPQESKERDISKKSLSPHKRKTLRRKGKSKGTKHKKNISGHKFESE